MKRTLMFSLLCAVLALISGCSSAQAACPGGNCSLGVWSPWGGVWYYQSPCAGGKCSARPNVDENQAPKEPENPSLEPECPKLDEIDAAPETADEVPVLVEEPVLTAQPSLCEIVAQLVNRHRERLGLPALEIDPVLCRDCESHSEWMARGGGFRHGFYAGRECIAMGVRSGELVVNMWLGSSGHRAILLGVGKSIGVGRSGNYWTLRVR